MSPVWSRDGRDLFYINGETIMVAEIRTDGVVNVGPSREIYTSERLSEDLFGNQTFDTLPDGRLLIALRAPSDVRTRIVLGWDPS